MVLTTASIPFNVDEQHVKHKILIIFHEAGLKRLVARPDIKKTRRVYRKERIINI
jgi:hypothetical protein